MKNFLVNSRRMLEFGRDIAYLEDLMSTDGVVFEKNEDDIVYVVRNKRKYGYNIDIMFKADDVVELVKRIRGNDSDIEIDIFGAIDCYELCRNIAYQYGEWSSAAKWNIKDGECRVKVYTKQIEYIDVIRYIQNSLANIESEASYYGIDYIDSITFETKSQLFNNKEDINFNNFSIYRYYEINKGGVMNVVEGYKGYDIVKDNIREPDNIVWISFYGKIPDDLVHYMRIKDILLKNEIKRAKIYEAVSDKNGKDNKWWLNFE